MINKFSNRVHVKTETLNDKEYYYKILETGMVQFGAKMNFLWIYQVLVFIFILEIHLQFIFSDFNTVMDWASFPKKRRGLRE
jgi:hypothetical protein